ncbi:hypothetical protein ERX46_06510 [Brumimicrobium glaciale]|uniref:Uncharacterized protein n=1 Tax=Brumimicrobium glaciale TaxID=200475 RepID=A0A4Q4KNK1_9FLAO|nr:hypothetical protein [Brumimicrobium glaciale]RYM35021.1 hypothetical protein ERX46_06510 [Brumimicrobium glaciale]
MKKLSLIAMLTLLIAMLSFQSFAQNISSVIVSGYKWGPGNVIIETVKPDYTLETKEYSRKEGKHILIEIKKEVDLWLNKGFSIDQSNSNGGDNTTVFRYTYFLTKKEN